MSQELSNQPVFDGVGYEPSPLSLSMFVAPKPTTISPNTLTLIQIKTKKY